ncbi:hypothetical protein J6590_001242 [Homalodisca vitripennis]|nr:hypothetical protein J6590_001242 [Homalodisca vitripennis]
MAAKKEGNRKLATKAALSRPPDPPLDADPPPEADPPPDADPSLDADPPPHVVPPDIDDHAANEPDKSHLGLHLIHVSGSHNLDSFVLKTIIYGTHWSYQYTQPEKKHCGYKTGCCGSCERITPTPIMFPLYV